METKKIPIQWNGQKREVEIKRLTFGEKNDIHESAISTKIVGQNVQATLSQKTLKETSLVKGIANAPFEVNIDTIRNLPADIGDLLFEEIKNFNDISPAKKPG